MSRLLLVLCPQMYEGYEMKVVPCTKCKTGWNKATGTCTVEVGCEHLPDDDVPECPIQTSCRHQLQAPSGLCIVRQKGMICESALIYAGMEPADAMDHPLGFSAITVIQPEDM
jgi:hypothetical protein